MRQWRFSGKTKYFINQSDNHALKMHNNEQNEQI